jgi:hypothetical protein
MDFKYLASPDQTVPIKERRNFSKMLINESNAVKPGDIFDSSWFHNKKMRTNKEWLADNNISLESCTKYKRGMPLDKQTINDKLATIFSMKSGGHKTPVIVGVEEKGEQVSQDNASDGYDDDY